MSLHSEARNEFLRRGDDPTWVAKRKAEYDAICDGESDPNYGMQITSATVNGQSFTATSKGRRTQIERKQILEIILAMDAAGSVCPSQSHAYFP